MRCHRDLYSSDKVAEISYASALLFSWDFHIFLTRTTAIQGKKELVNKFRNSSVMLVEPSYRPKVSPGRFVPSGASADAIQVFATGKGPNAGNEVEFPRPNDPVKLRRSIANTNNNGMDLHLSG